MQLSLPHDDKLVVLFKHHPVKNDGRTLDEGRPIFDDMEVCEIRMPGSRAVSVFPATAVSHLSGDALYGTEEVKVTYAERFARQYRQFKEQQAMTISGTPLAHAPFLTEARRAELRALNVYTVEQLAAIDGNELKNLGTGGRELKNGALNYIETSKQAAPDLALKHELEALKARNEILEEDMKLLRERKEQQTSNPDQHYDDMTDQQLREFINAHTGGTPKGDVPRKTLIRMAREAAPKVNA